MSLRSTFVVTALALAFSACHSEMENVPLAQQNIYFSDKFFDVKALGPERALIIGYGGKILETTDGGASFNRLDSGTDLALYHLAAHGDHLWAAGQEGTVLHSADGGKSWQKQSTGTQSYLFSIFFLNENHGFAVGDRSVLVETTDGGKTWASRKITFGTEGQDADMQLAMQDPIFYDIRFVDENTGWIAGEFGSLLKTTDGGKTWVKQQETLMGADSGIVDPMDIPTFFGLQLVSAQEAYSAGLDGKVARTVDGGANWHFEPMKLEFPIVDPLYQPVFTPDGHGWAVGAAGEVVQREPGATEWTRADLGMQIYTWMRSIDFADNQNGWIVGGYGTILRTADGGKSWRLCLG